MKRGKELFAVLASLALVGTVSAEEQGKERSDCISDAEWNAAMQLSWVDFDQNPEKGWRLVADKDGCQAIAADMIAQYRRWMKARDSGLGFHQGQMHAVAGETDLAITEFKAQLEQNRPKASRLYIEATIAFLEQDLTALETAYEALLELPKPAGFDDGVAKFKQQYPDFDPPRWPTNVDVFEGFLACFNKPYAEAYQVDCRKAYQSKD